MPRRGYPCAPGCTCGRHRNANRGGYQESGEKGCTKCRATKPLSEFDVHHEGQSYTVYHARCKACRRDDTRENMRVNKMQSLYGITIGQYDDLAKRQGGVCAICGEQESGPRIKTSRPLSVDHDHLTGQVRGLLCSHCNRALGLFKEDVDVLKRAIYYLQRGTGYTE